MVQIEDKVAIARKIDVGLDGISKVSVSGNPASPRNFIEQVFPGQEIEFLPEADIPPKNEYELRLGHVWITMITVTVN